MNKMKTIAIVCLMFVSAAGAFGSSSHIFDEANQAYTAADYIKAADLYWTMIQDGTESASLYYNLGNSYYRLDQLGYAYWAFLNAHSLAPHDEDIYQNLKFVESKLTKVQIDDGRLFVVRWFDSISEKITATGWLLLALVLSVLFSLKILTCFKSQAYGRSDIASAVLLLMLCVSCLTANYLVDKNLIGIHRGVILKPETEIRYQPSYEGAVAFKLPEGAVIPITRKYGEWFQIRVSETKNGWVNEEEFRSLV